MVLDVAKDVTRLKQRARRAATAPVQRPELLVWAIALLTVVVSGLALVFGDAVSHAVFIPLVVLAGFMLSGPQLARALAVVFVAYSGVTFATWGSEPTNWPAACAALAVLVIVAGATRRRHTMGVPLSVGSGMLKDLRRRLDTQATPPHMPRGTHIEHCVLPARGDAFSGDFVVSAMRDDVLHVALTDVSGHGPSAGMRALLLSGALSGLLGETQPQDFLPAANRYLIRQGWRDGFASAIHVTVDTVNGRYCIGTAGHPSAAHYRAGTGRWEMISGSAGLLLGLFDQDAHDYARATGVLEPGDALLLYTDGVVEGADGDVSAGTSRMLALAHRAVGDGLEGAARRICEASTPGGGEDDRSVVMIWRGVPESSDSHEGADARTPFGFPAESMRS